MLVSEKTTDTPGSGGSGSGRDNADDSEPENTLMMMMMIQKKEPQLILRRPSRLTVMVESTVVSTISWEKQFGDPSMIRYRWAGTYLTLPPSHTSPRPSDAGGRPSTHAWLVKMMQTPMARACAPDPCRWQPSGIFPVCRYFEIQSTSLVDRSLDLLSQSALNLPLNQTVFWKLRAFLENRS